MTVSQEAARPRRVLITGAATGIGAAAVTAFVAAGARVVATYRETPPPEELRGRCTWVRCDARDSSSVAACFELAGTELGGLDVLIAAAGVWRPASPEALAGSELAEMLEVNLHSTVLTNQAAFGLMRDGGGGRIVNLGSTEGVKGNPLAPHYAASKAAVHAWTRSAAAAWGRYGITVNAVAPAVETPGSRRLMEHLGPERAAAFAGQLQAMIPLGGTLGDPLEDLAPVLVFLGSAQSRFITGQLIGVNGGLLMYG
ncbi:SDR family NAD(P)-dependent oxidoreductase [Nocardioides sp.]|uniref:SDR family NAD(P)-dependent oxidoreductase n=1 Tax=Nocardioides sp. TaxID=35761 RepID=UPI0039E34CF3